MRFAKEVASRFSADMFEVLNSQVIDEVGANTFAVEKEPLKLPKDLLVAKRILKETPKYQRFKIKGLIKQAAYASLETKGYHGYIRRLKEVRTCNPESGISPSTLKDATELTNGVIIKGIRDLLIDLKLLPPVNTKKERFKPAKKLRIQDINKAMKGYKRALTKQLKRSELYASAKVYQKYGSEPKKREVYFRQRYTRYCLPRCARIQQRSSNAAKTNIDGV